MTGIRQQRDATRLTVEPKQRAPTLRIITSMRWTGKRNNNPKVLTATIDSHHPKRPSKAAAQRFSVHLLALRGALLLRPAFFSTRSFHAARRAPASTSSLAFASRMWVAPILPHPPGMAERPPATPGQIPAAVPAQASSCRSPVFRTPAWRKSCLPRGSQPHPCASLRLRLRGSKQAGENQTLSSSYHSLDALPARHALFESSRAAIVSSNPAAASPAWLVETRCPVRLLEASRKAFAEGLRRGRGRNQAGPANKRSKRVTRIRIRASLMRPLVCTSYPAPRNSSRK